VTLVQGVEFAIGERLQVLRAVGVSELLQDGVDLGVIALDLSINDGV